MQLNSSEAFVLNRKYRLLWPDEVIFYQHRGATVIKNEEIWSQNVIFVGKRRGSDEFTL